ncbi:MAG: TVP38/TMEM64 family protein [Kiritimatiellia bacterium]
MSGNPSRRKRTWLFAAAAAAAALAVAFGPALSAAAARFDAQDLRDAVRAAGPWAPLLCILLNAAFTVLILPTTLVCVLVALLFGVARGLPICLAGLALGMASSFLLARHLFRDALERRIGHTKLYRRLEENMRRDGWKIVFFSRLLPINPYSFLNYAYGLTSLPFGRYLLVSTLGVVPNVVALLWTAQAAGKIARGQLDARVLAVLFAGAGLFAVLAWLPRLVRRKMPGALPGPGEDEAEEDEED